MPTVFCEPSSKRAEPSDASRPAAGKVRAHGALYPLARGALGALAAGTDSNLRVARRAAR
jgi:hypothetical protein